MKTGVCSVSSGKMMAEVKKVRQSSQCVKAVKGYFIQSP